MAAETARTASEDARTLREIRDEYKFDSN